MFDDDQFKTSIPLKTLLKPITKRRIFHIDVEEYSGNVEFSASKESIEHVEKQMNVKVNLNKPNDSLHYMGYREKYTDAKIKWQNDRHVLVLDIICISKSLDLKCLNTHYTLDAIFVEDINRKKDDITLKLV